MTFRGSPEPTVGVEMEMIIVDRTSGAIANAAPIVLDAVGAGYPLGEHPRIKKEVMQSTIEFITGICVNAAEARADLADSITTAHQLLAPHDLGLVSMGLHPWASEEDVKFSQSERYDWLIDRLQWLVRRLTSHGVHVHVGVRNGDDAIAIINGLRTYLPKFLALSASSPFRHGRDTGLESVRIKLMEALPISGTPPIFESWADFEKYFDALHAAGTVETIREIWWDIRPHPDFGTIEMRVCDGVSTLGEMTAIATLAHCLVVDFQNKRDAGQPIVVQPEWLVRENMWRATRYGLDAELIVDENGRTEPVRTIIEGLTESLADVAESLDSSAELASVRACLARGTSSRRQRDVVVEGGSLADVVAMLRRDLESELNTV